ncbi:MAG: trigger factor [Rickettsiales bacterium]
MQVTELEANGLKKKFKVVVDAEQINSQTELELKAAGERVKIPGFRPGYIPMKVLKQRYGKSVQADVLKQVINRSTADAITEQKLRPALTPQIQIESYDDGGDLTFTMELETFPEVPEIEFDKLTIERNTFEIEQKEIDEAVQRLAERSPTFEEKDAGAKAELGDAVKIDFKGMLDGEAFEGGTAKEFQLELGSGQFIPGFEDQLVGAKAGDDKEVNVTFPKEYHSEKLAGKDVVFEVKVHAVLSKQLPKIDDQFAKDRGFSDERALHEAVRDQLIREYDMVVRNHLKKQLFDVLEGACDFALPESMVEMEFKSIWERLEEAKKAGDESLADKSDDELKKEYQEIAERRVKLGIMLAEIGSRNKIEITNEELQRAVMQQASQFPGQEQQVMEFYKKNPERMEDLRGPILEEKSVDFILDKVTFSDKKVTIEELLKESEDDGAVKKKTKKSKAPAKKKKA